MSGYYTAQIYLIECTHPDYSDLKYVGLDTKLDPAYMSSSTVVKWHINRLGRGYFTKSILDTVTGSMSEICEVEQKYIKKFDAVRNPDFMNMSGGRQVLSAEKMLIDLDWSIQPVDHKAKVFIGDIISECSESVKMFTTRRQLLSRIVSVVIYGYLKYDQTSFEYSQHAHYGSSKPEDTQLLLTALSENGLLGSGQDLITITDELIERLEDSNVRHNHFKVVQLY